MKRGIGVIIEKERKKANLSVEALCKGICSTGELSRICQPDREPDKFLLERLWGRLGKSVEKLEISLGNTDYCFYELRDLILKQLEEKDYGELEKTLGYYESFKESGKPIHKQYIYLIRSICAFRKKEEKKAREYIENAIRETVPDFKKPSMWEAALSVDEMRLIFLSLWEEQDRDEKEKVAVYEKILAWLEKEYIEKEEKVRLYPQVVLELSKHTKEKEKLETRCSYALSLLRERGQFFHLYETLSLMIDIWERQGKNQKKVQLMKKEKEALEKLCIEFEVPLSQPIWQDALDRELYLDYELLQRSREAKNLAQETLCREICTQETLSRIERAKGKARADTFRRLAEELGRRGERCSTCIDTERYEILKLERQIGRYCRYEKFEEAKAAFEKLASYDLKDSKENLQYLTFEAALFDLLLGKTTHKEAILKYQEALDMTLSREEQKNLKNSFLTRQEATILNSIAIGHFRLSERDKAVSLLKTLQENLRQSNVDFRYHTRIVFPIWGNLASYLEETKDYAGSLEICRQAICLAFQTGQADVFQRFVTTKGCVLEDQERREESIECFIQAYYLSCLFADEKKVQLLKGHLESKYSIFLDE